MHISAAVQRQAAIYLAGVAGRRPVVPVDFERLEAKARRSMSRQAFAYVAGGAGSERTMWANRLAFEHWGILPRMLRDVSVRDTSIELYGQRLRAPLLLAPIGVLELAHREGDLAVARASAAEAVPLLFSNQASYPMEACSAVMGDNPRWFQLYWSTSDELVLSFVARAEACGCRALVVTLDTTLLGWRSRDLDLAYLPFLRGKGIAQYVSDPVFLASLAQPLTPPNTPDTGRPNLSTLNVLRQLTRAFPGSFWQNLSSAQPRRAVQQFVATYSRPSLTWENLAFLREHTKLPILLKGILHPDDARKAVSYGANGVIVSNHGGRQIDGAIGALEALPAVVAAIKGTMPVLFDSGIRSGADMFIAIALGATAVCLGRPYVYGLALAGQAGVQAVIQHTLAEFELTMALAGYASVRDITPEAVMRRG